MSEEGDRIRQRRERLGMHKTELAKEAGIGRDTVADIEAGKGFQVATMVKLQRALDALEEEAGIDAPPPTVAESTASNLVEIEVDGSRIIVRGPVDDAEALAELAARLVRQARDRDERD